MNPKNCTSTHAFLELVRAGLWEREARLLQYNDICYSAIMLLAEEQSIVGLVAAGLEHVVDTSYPKENVLQFVGQALQLEQRNLAMNQFIAMLIEKMRTAGIYTLLLKGQGGAQCYERPLWRACGDVDLFLSDDNYDKAKKFLTSLATCVQGEYVREKHLGMTIDSWEVELHGRLYCGLSSQIEKELDRVYQDAFLCGNVRSWNIDNVQVFLLSPENDAFYVFTHILQHFYKEGVGLRQVCDWCRLLWAYKDSLDRGLLELRIRRAGLMSEWKSFGAFAVELLGMPAEAMPFYSDCNCWKRKAKRISNFILNVGNMGHNRESNYRNYRYLWRKSFSAFRRMGDLFDHTMIFPLDTLRFAPYIIFNGVRSAIRGE